MPKILIVSIPSLPTLLDQVSGSALIPSDQQKYSENPIIPLKPRDSAANPLLDSKVSFHSTARTHSRPNQPLGAWEQGGFSREKRTDATKSEGSLDAVTSPHLCTCLLPQRLNPNPKGLNLCVLLGQTPLLPCPLRRGGEWDGFCQVLVNNLQHPKSREPSPGRQRHDVVPSS